MMRPTSQSGMPAPDRCPSHPRVRWTIVSEALRSPTAW